MPNTNPYLDLLQQDTENELRQSMMSAVDKQPDDEASIRKLATDYNLPVDAVRLDRPTVERKAKLDAIDYQTLAREQPATAAVFKNPDNAALMFDDIDNLTGLESALKFGKNIGSATASILPSFGEGIAGGLEFGADALASITGPIADFLGTPDVLGKPLARDMRALRQNQGALRQYFTPKADGNIEAGIYSGIQSLGQNLLTLPLAIASGNPLLMLNTLTGVTAGQSYGKARDKGLDPAQAALFAGADAAVEYGTEMLPVGALFKDLTAGTPLFKTLATQLATEIPGEQVATAFQDLNEWAVLNPERTFKDYLADRPDAAIQTLTATIVGTGGVVGTMKGAEALVNGQLNKAQQATKTAEQLQQVQQFAAASKVLQRDPDLVKAVVEGALANSDAQNVFIDANTLAQSGIAEQLAAVVPDVARQLPDALASNGEVKISMSDFATAIAPASFAQSILPHVRLEGEEFSQAQAQTYMENHQAELTAEMEHAMNKLDRDQRYQSSMLAVKDQVKQQLESLGHQVPQVNDHNATLLAHFYSAMGAKLGMSAETLWEKYPVNVQSTLGSGRGFGQKPAMTSTVQFGEFATGKPVTFDFSHNTESATALFGKPKKGDRFKRDLEPSGRYVIQVPDAAAVGAENGRVSGKLTFNNPLVLNVETWKDDLFNHYKKRGKALSKALIADGFDGVVTIDGKYGTSEILDLTTFEESKALYQTAFDQPLKSQTPLADNQASITVDGVERSTLNSNGMPIHPTVEGVENFWRWFGDSKVVDDQGRPLVVYHGTDAKFDTFKTELQKSGQYGGEGFFFTERLDIASNFGGNVMPVYLKAETGVIEKRNAQKSGESVKVDHIRAKDDDRKIWVVFDPTQIKSATGNTGAFNPSNPSILYQFAGEQAATANKLTLETAKQRLDAGEDAETIRQETGWFKGVDDKWRFEISDKDAKLKPAIKALNEGQHDAKPISSLTYKKNEDGTFDVSLNPPNPQTTKDFVNLFGISREVLNGVLPESIVNQIEEDQGEEDYIGNFEDAKRITESFEFDGFNALPLAEVLDHPALFSAYPSMANIMVQVKPGQSLGGEFVFMDSGEYVIRLGSAKQLSTLLHEVQHGVQNIEGFASGGSPEKFASEYQELKKLKREIENDPFVKNELFRYGQNVNAILDDSELNSDEQLIRLSELEEEYKQFPWFKQRSEISKKLSYLDQTGYQEYKRLAGETEARNTQTRANLSDEQRAAMSPESTQDVANNDVIVIFNGTEMHNAPMPQNVMNQTQRGAFDPESRTITLFDNADLSTFLHESGHLFLELQMDLVTNLLQEDELVGTDVMQKQLIQDTQTLLEWFGLGSIQEWYALDFEQKRAYHEQFAESFEKYLLEGFAPSLELARVFASFRQWLKQVYQSMMQYFDNVQLTDDVRGVFDRMLATDEQIALAQQGRSMLPLFADQAKSGMSETEFAEYQAAWASATTDAQEQLALKGVRDMQWLQNARNKTLKKLQATHETLRRDIRNEVRMDVWSQPIYQVWQFLTAKIRDEDKISEPKNPRSDPNVVDSKIDSLFVAIAKLGGLDKQEMIDRWNWDQVGRAPMPVFGKPLVRKENGLSIEAMSEKLLDEGYLTADEDGRYDTRQFEELFDAELRGKPQYSANFDSTILLTDQKAGSQVANILGLNAARLDAAALLGMLDLPDSAIQKVTELKMTARTGLHPDIVAELFGFSSGDELVWELSQVTPPKELIEQMTDQRMLQEHGEIATPEALQREADRALSNEARAKFVATEANMLSKMTGSVRLLTAAAKEMANNMIARVKVRDLSPSLYSRAEARAAKAALQAEKKGDMPTAAAEKRNQLINLQANKAAHQAQDDVEKIVKYLKKFDGNVKRVDFEYLDEIRGILQKYDFHSTTKKEEIKTAKLKTWVLKQLSEGRLPPLTPELLNSRDMMTYLSTLEQRDNDGNLIYKDDDKAVELLAELIDASEKQSYRDMTIEELRGLYDTVRVIEKMGRDKDKMFSIESAKRLSEIRLDMAQSVMENGGEGNKKTRTANDALGKKSQNLDGYGAAHIKASHRAWLMDGGKENGAVWRHLVMPANIKSAWEVEFKAGEVDFFNEVLRPILDDRSFMDTYGKGIRIDGLYGASLNFNERLAVLLNVGNESNMQRLMDGGIVVEGITRQLAPSHVMKILETFTAKELWAAQKIWDRFETYWPMIEEMEGRLTGKAPEKIPIRSITIKSRDGEIVTLRGGYYPVVFDQRTSGLAKEDAQASDLKEQQQASRSAATTRRSFAKSRVAEVYGRPLLLNLQGLYSGVNDVIHYLAWQEWILDTNRLLKPNTPFHEAVLQYHGPSAMDEMMKWKNDIVLGQRRLDHQVEKMVGFVRRNLSMASMMANFMTAATQPLGFTNTIGRIGAEWTARGVLKMASHPIKATQEALAYSRFMRNRTRTQFRDLHELRNMVETPSRFKEFMGKYGFWMMTHMQMLVDIPTWWGAYEKQLSVDPGDHDLAVQVADQAVKDSQGGGEEVDQSGMERGNALVKLFTGFYSYMATTGSLSYAVYKVNANKPKYERQSARTAANMLVLLVLPAQLTWMLQAALQPGGDDDDESLLKKIGKAQFSFMAGLFVGGRELSGLLDSYTGYHGPSGLRMFDDAYKLSSQAQQFFGDGEFDPAFRKALINMLGDLYGIPSAQINKTWTGVEALADDKTDNPAAVAFGFKK